MGKENKSRYALLGALSFCPMSGYDLKKFIEGSIGNYWNESYAQIYPMLKQLAEEGLTSNHVEKQEGRPERYVYELTEKGREKLVHWLAEPVEYRVERNELLLKLFMGWQLPTSISVEHLQTCRKLHTELLDRFETIEGALKTEHAQEPHLPYSLITLSYGKHIARAIIAWCDESLAVLGTLPKGEPLHNPVETTL